MGRRSRDIPEQADELEAESAPASPDNRGTTGDAIGEEVPIPLQLIRNLTANGQEAQSIIGQLAEQVENIVKRLEAAEQAGARWEERARALERELDNAKDRLRRTEDLLAQGTFRPASETAAVESTAAGGETAADSAPHVEADLSGTMAAQQVETAQTLFNAGPFHQKMASIGRSLGKPAVTLAPLRGSSNRLLLTIVWDIVWYKFLLDTKEEAPVQERLVLLAEGTEPEDLSPALLVGNAQLDAEGRLDASEVEFSLTQVDAELLEESSDQELEDATEELWEQKSAPEFRWED